MKESMQSETFEFSAKDLKEWDLIKDGDPRFSFWTKCELFYDKKLQFGPNDIFDIYFETVKLLFKEGPETQEFAIEELGRDNIRIPDNADPEKVAEFLLNNRHNNISKFAKLQKIFKGIDDEITNKYSFRLSGRK